MRIALATVLAVLCAFSAMAGPPIFQVESLSVALKGQYSYEPRNMPTRRGTVEFRVGFSPRPEGSEVHAIFGDPDYVVSSVTLIIDGKPQAFPVELLRDFGFSNLDGVLLWWDEDSKDVLLSIGFVAGTQRRGFVVRVHDGLVTQGPRTSEP